MQLQSAEDVKKVKHERCITQSSFITSTAHLSSSSRARTRSNAASLPPNARASGAVPAIMSSSARCVAGSRRVRLLFCALTSTSAAPSLRTLRSGVAAPLTVHTLRARTLPPLPPSACAAGLLRQGVAAAIASTERTVGSEIALFVHGATMRCAHGPCKRSSERTGRCDAAVVRAHQTRHRRRRPPPLQSRAGCAPCRHWLLASCLPAGPALPAGPPLLRLRQVTG